LQIFDGKKKHLGGFFLRVSGTGTEHGDELVGVDLVVVVDGEVNVGIIDLSLGELVTPGHEGVAEHVAVDVTLLVDVRLEGLLDDLVVVDLALVLLGEHVEEHGEVEGTVGLAQHLADLGVGDDATDLVEDGAQIGGVEDPVLVAVHDLEAFLHLGHLLLGEHVEHIAARALGLLGGGLGTLGRHLDMTL